MTVLPCLRNERLSDKPHKVNEIPANKNMLPTRYASSCGQIMIDTANAVSINPGPIANQPGVDCFEKFGVELNSNDVPLLVNIDISPLLIVAAHQKEHVIK